MIPILIIVGISTIIYTLGYEIGKAVAYQNAIDMFLVEDDKSGKGA